jgi:hypothetical protein
VSRVYSFDKDTANTMLAAADDILESVRGALMSVVLAVNSELLSEEKERDAIESGVEVAIGAIDDHLGEGDEAFMAKVNDCALNIIILANEKPNFGINAAAD